MQIFPNFRGGTAFRAATAPAMRVSDPPPAEVAAFDAAAADPNYGLLLWTTPLTLVVGLLLVPALRWLSTPRARQRPPSPGRRDKTPPSGEGSAARRRPGAEEALPGGKSAAAPSATRDASSRTSSGLDATASPEAGTAITLRSDETSSLLETPSAECVASAMALAQRVRDLGLHLGDVSVTGVSFGLPNARSGRAVFAADNAERLMSGDVFIGALPAEMLEAQLERNVVQVHKTPAGVRERRPLSALADVIQLASRVGDFDLCKEVRARMHACIYIYISPRPRPDTQPRPRPRLRSTASRLRWSRRSTPPTPSPSLRASRR